MKTWREMALLLMMSLTGARSRLGSYLVTIVSVMCVVGVLVAMLSMSTGAQALAARSAPPDRAVVESAGAQSTYTSNFSTTAAATIADLPGIRRDAQGQPLATAMSIVITTVHKKVDGSLVGIPIYAVDGRFFKVYPELHLTAGHMFQPGLDQLLVAQSDMNEFRGLNIGDHLRLRGANWTIVGTYAAGGGAYRGLIGDLDTVGPVFQHSTIQTVTLLLQSPSSFGQLAAALKADPSMDVEILHEAQVLEQATGALTRLLNFISYVVGVIMAIGATLGAINVMYSIVDGRRRDLATLRAIGFGAGPIAVSVLAESLVLALPGAVLGVLGAWLFFNGHEINPGNASIHLLVTWPLALIGVVWAVAMGLIGGLTPAIRAARVPVATALRAT